MGSRNRPLARLALALALAASALGCGDGSAGSDPPNLVLILIDTLRADKLGAYGFPLPTSPELDALAQQGVRFDHVIAQTSWTRPSVASLLTSRYPRSLGIYREQSDALALRFETLAEVLGRHGYYTLGLTANPNLNTSFQFDQGFDEYVDSRILFSWMSPEPGKVPRTRHPVASARELFEQALERLRSAERRPVYLQIVVMDVHAHGDPRTWPSAEAAPAFDQAPPYERPYLRALRGVSAEIDRFLRGLREVPGFANTLVVITSDHGEGLLDHPGVPMSRMHGRLLYESQLRVPLILYDTGGRLPEGRVVKAPVRLLDVAPTLLDLLSLPIPPEMRGVSLRPLVLGSGESALPQQFFVETEFKGAHKLGVYAPGWKYFENLDRHPGVPKRELQPEGVTENGSDTDVAAAHPEVREQLAGALAAWTRANARQPPVPAVHPLSPEELDQLRRLGYRE